MVIKEGSHEVEKEEMSLLRTVIGAARSNTTNKVVKTNLIFSVNL